MDLDVSKEGYGMGLAMHLAMLFNSLDLLDINELHIITLYWAKIYHKERYDQVIQLPISKS